MSDVRANTPKDGKEKAILQQIKDGDKAACSAVYEKLKEDPNFSKIITKMERDIAIDVALQRAPVTGPHRMALVVSEQAYDKLTRGDTLGAASNYAATVVVGLASAIPFVPLGDAAIEGLRLAGVDLEPSPIRKAINTATGVKAACDNLNAVVATYAKRPGYTPENLETRLQHLGDSEIMALRNIKARLDKAQQEVLADLRQETETLRTAMKSKNTTAPIR